MVATSGRVEGGCAVAHFCTRAGWNTAVAAVDRLKEHDAGELRFVCLLATPVGLANFHGHHPDVRVWTAAIDEQLSEHGYILPGLGDAGDRLYGTR
jgi:uracil phosphoribosyltransferase